MKLKLNQRDKELNLIEKSSIINILNDHFNFSLENITENYFEIIYEKLNFKRISQLQSLIKLSDSIKTIIVEKKINLYHENKEKNIIKTKRKHFFVSRMSLIKVLIDIFLNYCKLLLILTYILLLI